MKFHERLRSLAHPRNIVIASVCALVVLAGIRFGFIPRIEEATGGLAILDLRLNYTPADVFDLFDAAGEEGRRLMVLNGLLDLVFPLAYAAAAGLLLAFLFGRAFPPEHFLQRLVILPFVLAAVDYLENAGILMMLARYPERLPDLARATAVATSFKQALALAMYALIVAGVVAALIRRKDRT